MKRGGAVVTSRRVSPVAAPSRKHVKVELDEEKENFKLPVPVSARKVDLKGKGRATPKAEEVDFDALLDGMDRDGVTTSQETKPPVAVSGLVLAPTETPTG